MDWPAAPSHSTTGTARTSSSSCLITRGAPHFIRLHVAGVRVTLNVRHPIALASAFSVTVLTDAIARARIGCTRRSRQCARTVSTPPTL